MAPRCRRTRSRFDRISVTSGFRTAGSCATQADYQNYAKIQIIPLVVTPDDTAVQDSTPIIEQMEAPHPEPSIHPPEAIAAFISALIEEFGDEWGNKWMFHLPRQVPARVAREVRRGDRRGGARRRPPSCRLSRRPVRLSRRKQPSWRSR
jgi:hypothetical protein